MNKDFMNDLYYNNVNPKVISQLYKLEEKIGADLEDIISVDYDVEYFNYIDLNIYRKLREDLTHFSKKNCQNICKYFFEGVDVFDIIEGNHEEKKTMLLLECQRDKDLNGSELDYSILLDPKYDYNNCVNILKDLKNGIDVKIYLESDLPDRKKKILKYALEKGVNIEDDLKKFKFIKNKVMADELISLKKLGLPYEKVLTKTKDSAITALILEHKQKFDIDLLPYYYKNIRRETLSFISSQIIKGEDMTPFKGINNINKENFDLYKKIYENLHKIKPYKDYSTEILKAICDAIDCNNEHKFGEIDIDKCISQNSYYSNISYLFDCYKYKQPELIEELKPFFDDWYKFAKTKDDLRKLIIYNYEHENKIDIPSVFYNYDSLDLENEMVIKTYINYIVKDNIPQLLIDKVKPLDFNSNETKIIFEAYLNGFDIDIMLDKRMTIKELQSIYDCMKIGLKFDKESVLCLSEKEKRTPEVSRNSYVSLYGDGTFYEMIPF